MPPAVDFRTIRRMRNLFTRPMTNEQAEEAMMSILDVSTLKAIIGHLLIFWLEHLADIDTRIDFFRRFKDWSFMHPEYIIDWIVNNIEIVTDV